MRWITITYYCYYSNSYLILSLSSLLYLFRNTYSVDNSRHASIDYLVAIYFTKWIKERLLTNEEYTWLSLRTSNKKVWLHLCTLLLWSKLEKLHLTTYHTFIITINLLINKSRQHSFWLPNLVLLNMLSNTRVYPISPLDALIYTCFML